MRWAVGSRVADDGQVRKVFVQGREVEDLGDGEHEQNATSRGWECRTHVQERVDPLNIRFE